MGRIVARLVDADTGAPIEGAFATLLTLDRRAVSDSTGTLSFLDLAPGDYDIEVRHIAYGTQTIPIEVQGVQTAVAAIPLSQTAVEVEELDVLVEHRPRYLEEKGFYDRQLEGIGTFFDPQFVQRWGIGGWTRADDFIELLLDLSPGLSTCTVGGPQVLIDGQPVFDDDGRRGGRPSTELEMLATYAIGAVEVYSSSQGVPYEALLPGFGCGSIIIWTNRWRGRTRELGGAEIELCEQRETSTASIEGTIRDEFTGVLLPGAHVRATRYPVGRPQAAKSIEVIADKNARYRVCDIPVEHALTLRVSAADREGPELEIPSPRGLVQRDLTVRVAGPGDMAGRIVDRDTGAPIAAADVIVADDGARTQTDADGYFRLDDVPPGDHVVQVAHLGFEPLFETITIVADRTVDLRVEMSVDPIELEPLVVTAIRDRRLEIRGYYDRRLWAERTGLGTFIGDEEIRRRAPALTSSLFREIPGITVECRGTRDCVVKPTRTGCAQMNIFLNGALALGERRADPVTVDELVLPGEIVGVEAYAGGASIPPEFAGASGRCGAIAIWTR
ncbi:MAG: carboxypeptidase regulatory-like domain-containing protein [Gemmatimonadetes bacterium]|nr:carboxypeptidase regulatory-like domain-containing protein [Gemmatimonadota bacterium]